MRRRRGECTSPPDAVPRPKWSGAPRRLPPSDSLRRGVCLVGHAIRPIYTAFRDAQDLPRLPLRGG
jgi:hypothetical protein